MCVSKIIEIVIGRVIKAVIVIIVIILITSNSNKNVCLGVWELFSGESDCLEQCKRCADFSYPELISRSCW